MGKTPWKENVCFMFTGYLKGIEFHGYYILQFFSPFSRKLLYSRKVSKPKSLEIKYPRN